MTVPTRRARKRPTHRGLTLHAARSEAVTHPSLATAAAIGIEAGMTVLLVGMIFVFVSRERLMSWTPLMLWPLIGVLVWRGSPYTGTS